MSGANYHVRLNEMSITDMDTNEIIPTGNNILDYQFEHNISDIYPKAQLTLQCVPAVTNFLIDHTNIKITIIYCIEFSNIEPVRRKVEFKLYDIITHKRDINKLIDVMVLELRSFDYVDLITKRYDRYYDDTKRVDILEDLYNTKTDDKSKNIEKTSFYTDILPYNSIRLVSLLGDNPIYSVYNTRDNKITFMSNSSFKLVKPKHMIGNINLQDSDGILLRNVIISYEIINPKVGVSSIPKGYIHKTTDIDSKKLKMKKYMDIHYGVTELQNCFDLNKILTAKQLKCKLGIPDTSLNVGDTLHVKFKNLTNKEKDIIIVDNLYYISTITEQIANSAIVQHIILTKVL